MRLGTRNERMREGENGVERQRFHDLGGGWLETSETSIHGDGIERGRSRLFVRGKQRPSNRASAPSSSLSTVVAFRSSLPATFASPPRIDVHPSVANWKLDELEERRYELVRSRNRIVLIFTDIEIFR